MVLRVTPKGVRGARPSMGVLVGVFLVEAASCTTVIPSPTTSGSPAALPTESPSPTPVSELPLQLNCAKSQRSAFDCADVLAAVLPYAQASDAPVVSMDFFPGSYCPPNAACIPMLAYRGYVVFHCQGKAGDFFVNLVVTARGRVKVVDGPAPFPPPAPPTPHD
jgi:hypothetical protein